MFKKKWIIAVLIISVLVAGGIYLILKSASLTGYFKDRVAAQLEELLGRRVSIETIETNFVNRVTLGKIRIAQGADFSRGDFIRIDKVSINLNLLRLIARRSELINTINRIEIIKPVVFINNKQGDWNIGLPVSKGAGTAGLSLKSQIYIYRGQVIIEDT
ncbi:MAG: hypothetical protein V1653_03045, partial [bacterium]